MRTRTTFRRAPHTCWLGVAVCVLSTCCLHAPAQISNTHAATPAGSIPTSPIVDTAPTRPVSAKEARAADDAYLQGAKQIDHGDYAAAERSFGRALTLNPQSTDYLRAFAYAREGRVSNLVHQATTARQGGDLAKANALLAEAKTLDPDNSIIAEHLDSGSDIESRVFDPFQFPIANVASTLAGAPELAPDPGKHTIHERGNEQDVITAVYRDFGLKVQFDAPLPQAKPLRFDLEDVDFRTATSLLEMLTRTFAVPIDPKLALIAADTQTNRTHLEPLLEETIYMRGMTNDEIQSLANLARNIFDVATVTASSQNGTIILRTSERKMKLVNAEYADMLDGGSDVLVDISVYEVDRARTRDYGATFPSSLSFFDIEEAASSALSANQSIIAEALQSGALKLTGNALTDTLAELSLLYAAGALSPSQVNQFTSLLGTIGNYNKVPLLGVAIASGSTITAMLQSSDARLLDTVQLRAGDAQKATFRAGTRYPIETSSYTTGGTSSAIQSALAGASSAIQQAAAAYLGSGSSVTIPQISYEDLGLTIDATPKVHRDKDIALALHFKVEALGAGSLNGIPVLNNREFTSTATVPAGQTALLASGVNSSELKSIQGFPGLNELPGFQGGTEHDSQTTDDELLITITPHLVREPAFHITSRRVLDPAPAAAPSIF
jgi:general secretion pathway protein D